VVSQRVQLCACAGGCGGLFGACTVTGLLHSAFSQRGPTHKSEPAVRDARLALCALFGKVLAKGLSLLGIETPNRI